MQTEKILQFAQIIANSKKIVFFGGAGVSTESGLKDYRSKDGIYASVQNYGYPPEEILNGDFLRRKPQVFYAFYRDVFLASAEPNPAHRALAALEREGKLLAVVTQNVDNLHQTAGSRSVLELHGTTERYHCIRCRKEYGKQEILHSSETVPKCGCGGIIRPDVVLYGEPLEEETVTKAVAAISQADTLIIGGTSLAVYPAASFVRYFQGDHLVIINMSETQYDGRATLVFHDKIGVVLETVMQQLHPSAPEESAH